MRELTKIAEELFDKIRSRFENVSVGDELAKNTTDPAKARFFNFDYVARDGQNFGNITISIIDEQSLKVYFSKNITSELNPEQRAEWFDFLRNMRQFARRNLLSFDTRDITRSNLKLRDLKHVSAADGTQDASEVRVSESKMFGSSKSSYQSVGPVRLVVRHKSNIDEAVPGSRTRNIESIFVETHLGERFLLPFTKLNPARAMARHISEGGIIQDEIGQHIVNVVKEMSDMSVFVRNMRNRTFEDAETVGMVEAATERYNELRTGLLSMTGHRGYQQFRESFKPQDTIITEDDMDIDALKERFVKKVFDDRLSEALPHVYRAYQKRQLARENAYVAEFDDWATSLTEDEDDGFTDDDLYHLRNIMSKPLTVGVNGTDASAAIDPQISSDALDDEFYQLSQGNPGSDARPVVISWLRKTGENDLAQEFSTILQNETSTDPTVPQPGELTPQANHPGPQSPPAPQNSVGQAQPGNGDRPTKPFESIDQILRLAGLAKKV